MTPTDIANLALDILKEGPIGSIEDARPTARWLKRNFDISRDALLEETEWDFATRRVSLPADTDGPAFGWDYSYTLPADSIRVIPLTVDGEEEGDPIPHSVEGGKVLTDAPPALKLIYVFRCEDYARYPATFVDVLSARLATRMAHWLTGKSNYVTIAQGLYNDAMRRAWLSSAVQGTAPRAADNDWVNAR